MKLWVTCAVFDPPGRLLSDRISERRVGKSPAKRPQHQCGVSALDLASEAHRQAWEASLHVCMIISNRVNIRVFSRSITPVNDARQCTAKKRTQNTKVRHNQCVDARLTFPTEHTAEPGLLSFFNSLPHKSPESGTLRLFYRGGADNFYSAYGPDALFVAQHVFQTNTVIKYLGAGGRVGGLPSVALKTTVAHTLLREALTTRQLRVEIYSAEPGKRQSQFKLDKEVRPSFSPHIFYQTEA